MPAGRNKYFRLITLLTLVGLVVVPAAADDDAMGGPPPAKHVIHISVDGLRADAVTRHSPDELPHLFRLRNEGVFTDNARTDVHRSNTLPNHTSQLTGRSVLGPHGHQWTKNSDPDEHETLHSNRGEYVASVFDVAHDHGLSTALYTTKSKFILYDRSYNETNGAPDRTGDDNGRDKIDRFVYIDDTPRLVDRFVRDMQNEAYEYAFIHLRDPDTAGHYYNWDLHEGSAYLGAVHDIDRELGKIFDMVDSTPELAGNTVIILTADHGGGGNWHNHGDASHIENYTIPFYVWGVGVASGEIYTLNRHSRRHPGMGRPTYDADVQPVRNGDAGNLALAHLGLFAVPGSTINAAHDLRTFAIPASPAYAEKAPASPANAEGTEARPANAEETETRPAYSDEAPARLTHADEAPARPTHADEAPSRPASQSTASLE